MIEDERSSYYNLLTPRQLEGIDPHVRELVRVLNHLQLWTFASCEGHLDPEKSSRPWVLIDIESSTPEGIKNLSEMLAIWNSSSTGTNYRYTKWIISLDLNNSFIIGTHRAETIPAMRLTTAEENKQRDPKVLVLLHRDTEELARFLSQQDELLSNPEISWYQKTFAVYRDYIKRHLK